MCCLQRSPPSPKSAPKAKVKTKTVGTGTGTGTAAGMGKDPSGNSSEQAAKQDKAAAGPSRCASLACRHPFWGLPVMVRCVSVLAVTCVLLPSGLVAQGCAGRRKETEDS